MARPKKIETPESAPTPETGMADQASVMLDPVKEQFDPSLPESKQRHLR